MDNHDLHPQDGQTIMQVRIGCYDVQTCVPSDPAVWNTEEFRERTFGTMMEQLHSVIERDRE